MFSFLILGHVIKSFTFCNFPKPKVYILSTMDDLGCLSVSLPFVYKLMGVGKRATSESLVGENLPEHDPLSLRSE